jgi:diacylglycerol O-acyltransferase
MAEPTHERLSFLDTSFLALESPETHMHVGSVMIFDSGSLINDDGGLDVAKIRAYINGRIHMVPRYRQKLAWIPLEQYPVWVDDPDFSIEYHVRHTALPRPGTTEQLRQLASRLISHSLDRNKPMWEIWIAEGLEDGKFGLISKIHHSMIDGVSGVDLMAMLMNLAPDTTVLDPTPWTPKVPPSGAALLVGDVARRTRAALDAAKGVGNVKERVTDIASSLSGKAKAAQASIGSGWLTPSSKTPLNEKIGPNRRFAWTHTALSDVKSIRKAFGATVNDVLLAITAGAVKSFLEEERSFDTSELAFRAMNPVSVRTKSQSGTLGNQVAMWLVHLHLEEPDAVKRLSLISAETMNLKKTNQAEGASALVAASSGTPQVLLALGLKAAAERRPFNMTVTNVPGPPVPLYLLDAPMQATYPIFPLWQHHGIGVALFSYLGSVAWGIVADWDLVPDIEAFTEHVDRAAAELLSAAQNIDPPE